MYPRAVSAGPGARAIRLLARLEKLVGGVRGWAVSGLALLAALLGLLMSGLHSGVLGKGSDCWILELTAGLIPVATMGLLAFGRNSRLSTGSLLTIGTLGGVLGLAGLELICPLRHVAQHVLVFHVGGLIAAGMAGVAVSRLPAFR
jgi:hypothetical protein